MVPKFRRNIPSQARLVEPTSTATLRLRADVPKTIRRQQPPTSKPAPFFTLYIGMYWWLLGSDNLFLSTSSKPSIGAIYTRSWSSIHWRESLKKSKIYQYFYGKCDIFENDSICRITSHFLKMIRRVESRF